MTAPINDSERIQREAALIAEGQAAIAAGRYIADEDLDAWLDELDRDPDAPIPIQRSGSRPILTTGADRDRRRHDHEDR